MLTLDKFKPLINSFELGNWIRVQINDEIYKLRLIEYEFDYGSLESISVEFSDVTKVKNGISDLEDVLSQASSMATSYEYTQRQAKQGDNVKGTVDQWLESGLNSALVRIKSNNNEEVTLGKYGLLCRSYDDITETYSPEQFRLTHNIMAYTTDNWETVSAALGKHDYKYYDDDKKLKDGTDYGLSAKFVTAGNINGSQIIGGELYSDNYTSTTGTYMDLAKGDFSLAGGRIKCLVDKSDDKKATVTLKDVAIVWDSNNSPSISNINGLQNALNGKSTVYTSKPSSQRVGDLLVPTSTFTDTHNSKTYTFTANRIYKCTETSTSFNPSKWSDTIANSAYSLADNAKNIGDMLVNGLGFEETEITGQYVISPVIAGGYLLIGDTTGVYAEISTGGKLKCTGAEITGKITATSGDIGGWGVGTNALVKRDSSNNPIIIISGSGTQTNNYTVGSHTGKDWTIWSNSKFGVTNTGKLYATGADISGNITATSGDIGGWNISSSGLSWSSSETNNKTSYFFGVGGTVNVLSVHDKDGNIPFCVSKQGKLTATGANITGEITATSLTLSGTKVSTSDISGLSTVATSGKYTDLTGRPTIPSSAADLGIDANNIVYKGDIKQITKTANGVTYTQTSVPTSSGTVTYDTYDAGDYIVFGGYKGTNSDGKDYICVSKTGLLTARNALIYGTVYATDGEFTGKITASGGEITGSLKVDGMLYHENGDYRVTLRAVRDDKSYGVFYITDNSSGTAKYPFVVGGDGSLRATKATITGDSTFGGKLDAVSGSFTSLTAGKSSFTEELVKIDAGAKSKGAIKIGYTGGSYTDSGGQVWDDITISPSRNLIGNIGTPQYYWDRLCVEKTLNPSDRNLKKDISKMDEKQEQFFNLLSPVTYKFIHGTSDRYHYGFISQDVEEAIVESGLTPKDFAGFCKDLKRNEDGSPILDKDGNQEYIYSLSYTEFIALNTHMIQKVQAENQKLKERVDSLEQMIRQLS